MQGPLAWIDVSVLAEGLLVFCADRPEPLVLDLELTPEGTDPYWVGGTASTATPSESPPSGFKLMRMNLR